MELKLVEDLLDKISSRCFITAVDDEVTFMNMRSDKRKKAKHVISFIVINDNFEDNHRIAESFANRVEDCFFK